MSDVHFVKESVYGSLPKHSGWHLNEMTSASSDTLSPDSLTRIAGKREGYIQLSKSNCRLSILAPKEIKKLFGCERIEVEVPSIKLKFESGPVLSEDGNSRGYKLPGSRVVNLKAGKYRVNLKRWSPIVKFKTEAPEPRWPCIVAAALWVAKKAGMQSPTNIDVHCGPRDSSSLQVVSK